MKRAGNSEVLEQAVALLGSLKPKEEEAVRFLLSIWGDVSTDPLLMTYREARRTLEEIESAALKLQRSLTRLEYGMAGDLKTINELIGHSDSIASLDAAQVIATRARGAINELQDYKVKGGRDAFRVKIGAKSSKQYFAEQCSSTWFLTGNSFGRGSRARFIRFLELAYEFSTGDADGRGLRDLAVKAQEDVLTRYSTPSDVQCHIEVLEQVYEANPEDDFSAAQLVLLRAFLSRQKFQ
jgi:hypothetical protein